MEIKLKDNAIVSIDDAGEMVQLGYIFTGLENDTLKGMTEYEFIEDVSEKLAD